MVRDLTANDHFPDYAVSYEEDHVTFSNRNSMPSIDFEETVALPPLDSDTYEQARSLAPGWDVRVIEQEWREWITERPRNPDKAFLGFCKKWFERRGRP